LSTTASHFDASALQRITARVQHDIDANIYDGARIMVAHRGATVLDLTLGYADRAAGRTLLPDAAFSIMSISKVLTAVALLRCVERGQVSLLTPVASVIPEFAARGKGRVTVGQVLTHTAGLGMGYAPLPTAQLGDMKLAIASICSLPLESAPGEQVSYSASMGFTLLAEIASRLDPKKRSYRQIITEDIFEPLGMHGAAVGLTDSVKARRVPVVVRDDDAPEINRKVLTERDESVTALTELPSGGGTFATANDILRLGEALRQNGALDGARILSPAMVQLMRRNQTGLKPNSMMNSSRALHGMEAFPAFLGLGRFLRGEGVFPCHIATLASNEAFGGWGLGSMGFWVDPKYDVSFVALTAGLMERIRNLVRFQGIGDMFLSSLVEP